jgi:hypothetical protein
MLHDLEKADGWADLTEEEQMERIRAAFDAQWRLDHGIGKQEGKGRAVKKGGNTQCNCLDPNGVFCEEYKVHVCGVEIRCLRKVFHEGKQVGTHRWCRKHGGLSAGASKDDQGNSNQPCKHLSCAGQAKVDKNYRRCPDPTGVFKWWGYCTAPHKAADAPRVALFEDIRKALGWDDPVVQAKLTALNTKQQPETPAAALAQLNTILAADNVLQALQDALDAGPSGANAP